MRLIGLIGGVSPESTAIYYRLLNEHARAHLGGQHSAKLLLYALDYGTMIKHYDNRDWDAFIGEVVDGASHLKRAGVEAIAITSNTTHVAADAVAKATNLPVIHLLDVLSDAMREADVERPLLLGTPVVMAAGHYRQALAQRYQGKVLTPADCDQEMVGKIILDELVNGTVLDASREVLLSIIARSGADGVILGCTELCMILSQTHCELPVFDTTALHAKSVSDFSFGVR